MFALVLAAAPAITAMAQTRAPAPTQVQTPSQPVLPLPANMTLQEYQGLSCMAFGLTAALGVYVYSDVIIEALSGTVVNPLLLVPVLATGFAAGCGVGATMSPGFLWIVSRF